MAPTAKTNKGDKSAAKPAEKKAAPAAAAAAKGKVEKPKAEAKPATAAAKNVKKAPEAAKEVKATAKPAAAKPAPAKDAKKSAPAAAAPKKDAKAAPAKDAKKAAPAAAKPAAAAPAKKAEPAKPAAPAAAPAEKPKAPAAKAASKPQRKSVTAATASGKVGKKNVLRGKGLKKKKVSIRFGIDCTNIAEDNIMDVADFEKYVKARLKVNGKVNNLGNNVTFERLKMKLYVNSDVHFSKAYLKYLTKRYLKKNSLRDWIRVVSNDKDSYELRYFRISSNDDEDEDAE
ncbi:PREDICTED: 60S ribosomal protein L22 [Rhagoletis zephyria]|uniref:60S ribosomal protein L22 n=1 Tax=Rhagoletis zephyria TaxID=28612 RepID=UPI0008119298|nr:PREDICTED: 60S ribosomal protein L22 [Rhagoletis zephyria]XP_036339334.1 60S ribosomal protein L22 [Rhagoletis pomonella]